MLLAVLGTGIVDPATPVIRADDPGVTRGDGCFEGIRLLTGPDGSRQAAKLDRHLARMARSAAALEIAFDPAPWQELVADGLRRLDRRRRGRDEAGADPRPGRADRRVS